MPVGLAELALAAGMWATGAPGMGAVVLIAAGVVALFYFAFTRSRQQARRLRLELEGLGD